jgi:hypothetical protein
VGHQPELEYQGHRERRRPPAVRVRRRHPELHERLADIGVVRDPGNTVTPVKGDTIHIIGIVAFVDHAWNKDFSSSFGYSRQDNNNTPDQAPNAFKNGQYALGNVLYTIVPNVMVGGELQWGRRQNFSDGFHSDGFKLQSRSNTTSRTSSGADCADVTPAEAKSI